MELISPLTVQRCCAYIGRPVVAVLRCGTYVEGYLHRAEGGNIYLGMHPPGGAAVPVASVRVKKHGRGKPPKQPCAPKKLKTMKPLKARTSWFSPWGYGGWGWGWGFGAGFGAGLFTIGLASIAALWAFPFFWW